MLNSDLAYQLWYEAEQRQRRLETLYVRPEPVREHRRTRRLPFPRRAA